MSPTALARVPEAIAPGDADGWWAKKRAVLGSALVLTSPGIPMLFQGQELLEDRWFDDTVALDWEKASTNRGHPAAPPRPHRAAAGPRRRDARPARLQRRDPARRPGGQGPGDAPLDGRRTARRHRRRRELRRSDARRRADRVPGARAAGTSGSTPTRQATPPISVATRPSTSTRMARRWTAASRAARRRSARTASWCSRARADGRRLGLPRVRPCG